MKLFLKRMIFTLVIFIPACSFDNESDHNIDSNQLGVLKVEKLREVLTLPTHSPNGELRMAITYGGNSGKRLSSREIFYPINGLSTYQIFRNDTDDTTGFSLNFLENDKIISSSHFAFQGGNVDWEFTREMEYSSDGLIERMYTSNYSKSRELISIYHYDSQNRLLEIEYPYEQGAELLIYAYDEEGKVISEWKTARGQEEHKVDHFMYRYNNGLLEAKETGRGGVFSEERKDALRYFYDPNERLILEEKFDPNFGFQQIGSIEYIYFDSLNY
ncbi:hypothetical protein [Arthrospiribacter ruber]|uniref:YD repeat-containing protein n=1 Tax=Arthrospiribacter ruber TaxID=2487934 RepID=A0A951MJV7_9BACT|nr:hypothetical protein [Arthrospiribacter ruber]MBW3470166.1 hypothetical protein [Arthrospiribacter ruber]